MSVLSQQVIIHGGGEPHEASPGARMLTWQIGANSRTVVLGSRPPELVEFQLLGLGAKCSIVI